LSFGSGAGEEPKEKESQKKLLGEGCLKKIYSVYRPVFNSSALFVGLLAFTSIIFWPWWSETMQYCGLLFRNQYFLDEAYHTDLDT
jgi:hypothetical protein